MSIAGVVLRGFRVVGTQSITCGGYGNFVLPNIGPGRIEVAMQRSSLEFTMDSPRLEFTVPKSVEEYTEVQS